MKQPRIQPQSCPSITYTRQTHLGKMFIVVVWDDYGPDGLVIALFGYIGKASVCFKSEAEAVGRLASLAMRYGAPSKAVADQLKGIACIPHWDRGMSIKSVADAFASVLYESIESGPPDMEGVPR